MSISTSATISADIDFFQQASSVYSNSFLNLQGSLGYSIGVTGGSGFAHSQIDSIYTLNGHVVPSGETYHWDFKALSGEAFGANYSIQMTGLKAIIIRNNNTGINEVLVLKATGTDAFTNLFHSSGSGNLRIDPGGIYMYSNPLYGVEVSSTNKNLYVTNVGSGASYGADGLVWGAPPGYNTGIAISVIAVGTTGSQDLSP